MQSSPSGNLFRGTQVSSRFAYWERIHPSYLVSTSIRDTYQGGEGLTDTSLCSPSPLSIGMQHVVGWKEIRRVVQSQPGQSWLFRDGFVGMLRVGDPWHGLITLSANCCRTEKSEPTSIVVWEVRLSQEASGRNVKIRST